MSYESRIFIINRTEHINSNGTIWIHAEKIVDLKMCQMDSDMNFRNIFTQNIDYPIVVDGETTFSDKYGEPMKYSNVKTVINYLEQIPDNYRRISILLGILQNIDESKWDNIQIVHYGY